MRRGQHGEGLGAVEEREGWPIGIAGRRPAAPRRRDGCPWRGVRRPPGRTTPSPPRGPGGRVEQLSATTRRGRLLICWRWAGCIVCMCGGREEIRKRMLIHVAAFNLGLLMRRRFGVGTPRSLQRPPRRNASCDRFLRDGRRIFCFAPILPPLGYSRAASARLWTAPSPILRIPHVRAVESPVNARVPPSSVACAKPVCPRTASRHRPDPRLRRQGLELRARPRDGSVQTVLQLEELARVGDAVVACDTGDELLEAAGNGVVKRGSQMLKET